VSENKKEGQIDLIFTARIRKRSDNKVCYEITIPKALAECGIVSDGKKYRFSILEEVEDEQP
jgi:hypothetical protein